MVLSPAPSQFKEVFELSPEIEILVDDDNHSEEKNHLDHFQSSKAGHSHRPWNDEVQSILTGLLVIRLGRRPITISPRQAWKQLEQGRMTLYEASCLRFRR